MHVQKLHAAATATSATAVAAAATAASALGKGARRRQTHKHTPHTNTHEIMHVKYNEIAPLFSPDCFFCRSHFFCLVFYVAGRQSLSPSFSHSVCVISAMYSVYLPRVVSCRRVMFSLLLLLRLHNGELCIAIFGGRAAAC